MAYNDKEVSGLYMVKKTHTPDFSRPVGANFVVALKTRSGEFNRYVIALTKSNGKEILRHTDSLVEAGRWSRFVAEDLVEKVKDYRCTGRVEKVAADNSSHTPVEPKDEGSEKAIKEFFAASR